MEELREQIERLLSEPESDDDNAPSQCERIEALVDASNWAEVLEVLLDTLRDGSRSPHAWSAAAEVLWGAVLDRRPMPPARVIAHLFHRWPGDDGEDNLAWSITVKLEGVSYLSEYDPLEDPRVLDELARLRSTDAPDPHSPADSTGPHAGPLPSIVIRLDPAKLANPDADLRYDLPDLLAARSDGVLEADGYDYEDGSDAMQIYFCVMNGEVDRAVATVIAFLETEHLHDNDLAAAATIGINETAGAVATEFRIVYPRDVSGTIETPKP